MRANRLARKIHIKGPILGLIGSFVVGATLAGVLFILVPGYEDAVAPQRASEMAAKFVLLSLLVAFVSSLASGFASAFVSRGAEINSSIQAGGLTLLLSLGWVLCEPADLLSYPLEYNVPAYGLTIPFAWAGGWLVQKLRSSKTLSMPHAEEANGQPCIRRFDPTRWIILGFEALVLLLLTAAMLWLAPIVFRDTASAQPVGMTLKISCSLLGLASLWVGFIWSVCLRKRVSSWLQRVLIAGLFVGCGANIAFLLSRASFVYEYGGAGFAGALLVAAIYGSPLLIAAHIGTSIARNGDVDASRGVVVR